MNGNNSQFKHTLVYGAIFGGFILLISLIVYMLGMLNSPSLATFAPAIYTIGAYISVRHFRDKQNNGFITFGKAFGTSFLTCCIMGSAWAIYGYLLYKYLSPGLMDEAIEATQEIWLNNGFSEAFVELATNSLSPVTMAFGYVVNTLFFGALLSLIIAAFLKRDTNPLLIDNGQIN